ncbi:alpha/beta-hydrolase [Diplogelasinospora grovesii]|uniref:Alpha/beta-hydrolase n=1 Tax=Diplogelasinospora grovesii TaxID=303347 RepID=A0AAN6MYS3_9PEZI|nr:alpha/beta-hydrolase [Diplogelasinospora grovesii]
MGFFTRSSKAKKESPKLQIKSQPCEPPPYQPLPPLPPRSQLPQGQPPQGQPPQGQPPQGQPPQVSRQFFHNWHPDDPYQPRVFQPAGLLPPPPGWSVPPHVVPPYQPPPSAYQPQPVIVNHQHYYLAPPPTYQQTSQGPQTSGGGSVVDLADKICPGTGIPQLFDDGLPPWHGYKSQLLSQGAALVDQISSRFDSVMTLIDRDRYAGNEKDLFVWQPPGEQHARQSPPSDTSVAERASPKTRNKKPAKDHPKGQTTAVAAAVVSGSYFAKVELYANSRLPMGLPPLRLYIDTWPLLCLAAQYSERVYERPAGAERDAHVDADWRTGTKAMVIKSVPMDYMNTIVFAIRGTATFMDWAVNLNTAPTSPTGFLDDPGNFCHAGFLSVARKMVVPVARRLRQLVEEDPGRASYSLLITGHSAGGAVAALLYSHMLATSKAAESELNILAGCFKRIHCITFGTPPVSLMPLAKPSDYDKRPQLKKSLFLGFVNEGDPVARADKAYVKSLLELFAAPAPNVGGASTSTSLMVYPGSEAGKKKPKEKMSKASLASSAKSGKSKTSTTKSTTTSGTKTKSAVGVAGAGPIWKVPPATLSSAGRIVVLRSGDAKSRLKGKKTVEERLNEGVVAQVATDEQLRQVIWGDPVCHVMKLYAGRIETLAVGAVTAKGF